MSKQSPMSKIALNGKSKEKANKRRWLHSPEILKNGHVVYQVKFLGKTEASLAKGIEVVKESITKLTFSNQLNLSEGKKIPKVELSISIDGVSIQNIKSKVTMYRYPLHQISYCADDKSDRKLFCFIAKEEESNNHSSFVFASEKLAEEITMTIGQAFDLAYRHFLETSGKEAEIQQRMVDLRKKVQELEIENRKLSKELNILEKQKGRKISASRNTMGEVLGPKNNTISVCPPPLVPPPASNRNCGKNNKNLNLLEFNEQPKVEEHHDYLEDIKDLENICNMNRGIDPFGMDQFTSVQPQNSEFKSSFGADKLLEMRDGFQRGISFGNDDFSGDCFGAVQK